MTPEEIKEGMRLRYVEMRKVAGLEAKEVAALLGVSYDTVRQREAGHCRVTREHVLALRAVITDHVLGGLDNIRSEVAEEEVRSARPVMTY